jgi:hypothetical protein
MPPYRYGSETHMLMVAEIVIGDRLCPSPDYVLTAKYWVVDSFDRFNIICLSSIYSILKGESLYQTVQLTVPTDTSVQRVKSIF